MWVVGYRCRFRVASSVLRAGRFQVAGYRQPQYGHRLRGITTMQCAYCGRDMQRGDITKDHVIPRSMFPKTYGGQRLTVKCYGACNAFYRTSEDRFRAWVLSGQAGDTEHSSALLPRLFQSPNKDLGLRAAYLSSIQPALLETPGGIQFGTTVIVELDRDVETRVLAKIARGLYFHETGNILPRSATVVGARIADPGRLGAQLPATRPGKSCWPEVFRYRFALMQHEPHASLWLMLFYDIEPFLVITRSQYGPETASSQTS